VKYWYLWLALCLSATVQAAVESVVTADGTEIGVTTHPASGDRLVIWLPSEAGPQAVDAAIATGLSKAGVEVWRVDLVEARFLPVVTSSMDRLPAGDVAAVLRAAAQHSPKRLFIVTTGRGAIPVLRGVRQWQQTAADSTRLGGVVLMSPKFFVATPDPGTAAELMPIVSASNVPLYLLQPDQSPWYWKLQTTLAALEHGGSDVYVRVLHGVRDRFYFRPDATAAEDALRAEVPKLLATALRALEAVPSGRRAAVPLQQASPAVREGKRQRALSPYRGDPRPPPLALRDLAGRAVSLADYQGRVVLVNFWASWCPPCVHEMPSMERLAQRLAGTPFVILGVNMAESPASVRGFLAARVGVSFPILLDSDGAALKRWQVFAFPTSFVIDKKGKIRYALFGATEWDDAAVVEKLRALLGEVD
jgi:thiol-disulfide isomerase/thioredoxin